MSTRPSKLELMVAIAHLVKTRSTCDRAQVGCIITDLDYTTIVSMGYNGNYRGGPDGCDRPEEQGNCGCVHAEANALVKAPYDTGKLALITTTSPCPMCAKLIINSRVTMVVYDTAYRDAKGIAILRRAGVDLYNIEQGRRTALYSAAGGVDWATGADQAVIEQGGGLREMPNFVQQSEAAHNMMMHTMRHPPTQHTDHVFKPHPHDDKCATCGGALENHLLR